MTTKYGAYTKQQTKNTPSHFRAQTAKSKAHRQNPKPTAHIPSNTMPTMNDIDKTRSDMREILWQNAELLQSDPNYRKKVWRYMSKVFYGNKSTDYNFDHWKQFNLPSSSALTRNNNRSKRHNVHGDDAKQQTPSGGGGGLNDDDSIDTMTQEKLALLLDREETYNDFLVNSNPNQVILMNKVRPKMEQILTAYACAHGHKFKLSGAVQLCAVILTTFNASNRPPTDSVEDEGGTDDFEQIHKDRDDNDCANTFLILQILSGIMTDYYKEDEKLMKDETLLLLDVLCVNEDDLVRRLNELNIDVIDLSVFVSSWIRCLFAHHFEMEFVQRVIDLVLLEGASVLITIVYGILQFMKTDLLLCRSTADVFLKLSQKMRNHLKKHEFISRVIQKAQLLFTEENYKYVIKGREKKSWPDLLALPGQRHFRIAKGIGDQKMVKKAYNHWRKESRKSIKTIGLGAEESSDEDGADDLESGGHHARNSSMAFWQSHLDSLNANGSERVDELERQLAAAKEEVDRLKAAAAQNGGASQIEAIPEDDMLQKRQMNGNASLGHSKRPSVLRSGSAGSEQGHGKSPTLSEVLYTSQFGDAIYQEPIQDTLAPREIQCRTEEWDVSWKQALQQLDDASISMQGYLCKMTASKWNSRGTLDKIQRRWFVVKGNFMTYFKTNVHVQPKSDKCVNLMDYKINPVVHPKSKFAFELISPPKPRKKGKSHRHRAQHPQDSPYAQTPSQQHGYERTKFVLIPDLEARGDAMQRAIRDKWVKSLRLAAKGPVLWDILLNLQCNDDSMTSSSPQSHSHSHHHHGSDFIGHNKHAQTAFTSSSSTPLYVERGHHSHYGGNGGHSPVSHHAQGHGAKQHHHSTITHRSNSQRQRSKAHTNRVGGNTSDYPDYPEYSPSTGKRMSAHSKVAKMTPSSRQRTAPYGM